MKSIAVGASAETIDPIKPPFCLLTVFLLLFFPSPSISLFLLLTYRREMLTVVSLLKYVLFLYFLTLYFHYLPIIKIHLFVFCNASFLYTSSFFFPKTKIISSFFHVRSCEYCLRCCHSFSFVHTEFFIIHNESMFAENIHIFTLKVTCHMQSHFFSRSCF